MALPRGAALGSNLILMIVLLGALRAGDCSNTKAFTTPLGEMLPGPTRSVFMQLVLCRSPPKPATTRVVRASTSIASEYDLCHR